MVLIWPIWAKISQNLDVKNKFSASGTGPPPPTSGAEFAFRHPLGNNNDSGYSQGHIPCPGIHIYISGAHLSTQGNKTNNLTFGEYQLYHPTQIFNVNSCYALNWEGRDCKCTLSLITCQHWLANDPNKYQQLCQQPVSE